MSNYNLVLVENLQKSIKDLNGVDVSENIVTEFLSEYIDEVEIGDVIDAKSLISEFLDYVEEHNIVL